MNSNEMQFYNQVTKSIYTNRDQNMYLGWHKNTHFGLNYNVGIFMSTYSSYSDPAPETYPK